jgi:hypothetical protein
MPLQPQMHFSSSIENSIWISLPHFEWRRRLGGDELDERQASLRGGSCKLVVKVRVVESRGCCIEPRGGKINTFEASPIDRSQAHGTRFAAREKLAARQIEAPEHRPRGTDGLNLGVGSRIILRGDLIGSARDEASVRDNESSERTAAGRCVFHCLGDTRMHECLTRGDVFAHEKG